MTEQTVLWSKNRSIYPNPDGSNSSKQVAPLSEIDQPHTYAHGQKTENAQTTGRQGADLNQPYLDPVRKGKVWNSLQNQNHSQDAQEEFHGLFHLVYPRVPCYGVTGKGTNFKSYLTALSSTRPAQACGEVTLDYDT